jgi:hypothetical protein
MTGPAAPNRPAQTERPRSPSKTATSMHRRAYEIVALLPTGADAAWSRQQPATVPIAPLIRREIRSINALVVDHWRRRNAEKIGDVAAVDVALDGDRENLAQRRRKPLQARCASRAHRCPEHSKV